MIENNKEKTNGHNCKCEINDGQPVFQDSINRFFFKCPKCQSNVYPKDIKIIKEYGKIKFQIEKY